MSHRDTVVFDLIHKELERQQEGIELIASENFVSQQVMDAMEAYSPTNMPKVYPIKDIMAVAKL